MRWLVAALVLVACSGGDNTLRVDLITDLVPGFEFDRLRVVRETDTQMLDVTSDMGFIEGQRVALFESLTSGTQTVDVELLLEGEPVVSRRVIAQVRGATAATAVITRDCRGVMCPDSGASPSESACLGGRCVDPACTPETPEFCPEAECAVDEDCPAMNACSRARCDEGACLYTSERVCDEGAFCDPERGCISADCTEVTLNFDTTGADFPSVAVSDSRVAVAWAEDDEVWVQEFTFGGLSEGGPRAVNAPGPARNPVIVADDADGFGLAFQVFEGSPEIYFGFVRDGVPTDPVRVTSMDGFESSRPDLVWNGSRFIVVWKDDRDGDFQIRSAPLQDDGAPGADQAITSGGPDQQPAAAWTPDGLAIVWQRGASDPAIFGTVRGESGIGPELQISPNRGSTVPELVYSEGRLIASWDNASDGTHVLAYRDDSMLSPFESGDGRGGALADWPNGVAVLWLSSDVVNVSTFEFGDTTLIEGERRTLTQSDRVSQTALARRGNLLYGVWSLVDGSLHGQSFCF